MAVKKKAAEQTAEDTAQAAGMAQEPPQDVQEGPEKVEAGENTQEQEKGQEEAQEPPQDTQKGPEEILVYVGPSLPRGKLKQNSIFRGTRKQIEDSLKEVIKEYPLVGKLLVPTPKLAEAKIKIASSGNILHKYYADVVSLINAEMEG